MELPAWGVREVQKAGRGGVASGMMDDPLQRFFSGRDSAPEYIGLAEADLPRVGAGHSVEHVRTVSRGAWCALSLKVVLSRVSVVIGTHG